MIRRSWKPFRLGEKTVDGERTTEIGITCHRPQVLKAQAQRGTRLEKVNSRSSSSQHLMSLRLRAYTKRHCENQGEHHYQTDL